MPQKSYKKHFPTTRIITGIHKKKVIEEFFLLQYSTITFSPNHPCF